MGCSGCQSWVRWTAPAAGMGGRSRVAAFRYRTARNLPLLKPFTISNVSSGLNRSTCCHRIVVRCLQVLGDQVPCTGPRARESAPPTGACHDNGKLCRVDVYAFHAILTLHRIRSAATAVRSPDVSRTLAQSAPWALPHLCLGGGVAIRIDNQGLAGRHGDDGSVEADDGLPIASGPLRWTRSLRVMPVPPTFKSWLL